MNNGNMGHVRHKKILFEEKPIAHHKPPKVGKNLLLI
jgi:hypothetical protein